MLAHSTTEQTILVFFLATQKRQNVVIHSSCKYSPRNRRSMLLSCLHKGNNTVHPIKHTPVAVQRPIALPDHARRPRKVRPKEGHSTTRNT